MTFEPIFTWEEFVCRAQAEGWLVGEPLPQSLQESVNSSVTHGRPEGEMSAVDSNQ